jgi:hypothetical protein
MWNLKRMQFSNYVNSIEREIKYHSNNYNNARKDKSYAGFLGHTVEVMKN